MGGKNVFHGIKVIALSSAVTGPWVTKCLADFGAEVLKVESINHPDSLRFQVPYKDGKIHPDNSAIFAFMNTGKMSINIDLGKVKGREIFKRLISEWADVVVQGLGPGVVEKLGLGYEKLVELKRDLLMINVSIFGQRGPYGRVSSWGSSGSCMAGHYSLTGWPDRWPTNPGLTVTGDILGPFYMMGIVAAALEYRRRTGKGQEMDITQIEPLANVFGPGYMEAYLNGKIPRSPGNRDPYGAPHGVYRCAGENQWCAISVFGQEQWVKFADAIGNPEWSKKEKFQSLALRKENEDELDECVESWTKVRENQEVMENLQKEGIAAGMVYDLSYLMDHDPQIKYRKGFVPIKHKGPGLLSVRNWPFRLQKTPPVFQSAPLWGEHTFHFICDVLGFSPEEFAEFNETDVLK